MGALALIDIDRHAVPLDNDPLSVAQRLSTSMVPTKLAVRPTETVHCLIRSSGLNCVMESPCSFWKVVGVQEGLSAAMLEVLKSHAAIVQQALIEIGQFAGGVR